MLDLNKSLEHKNIFHIQFNENKTKKQKKLAKTYVD